MALPISIYTWLSGAEPGRASVWNTVSNKNNYRIAGFFRGRKLSRISRFCGDSRKFSLRKSIFKQLDTALVGVVHWVTANSLKFSPRNSRLVPKRESFLPRKFSTIRYDHKMVHQVSLNDEPRSHSVGQQPWTIGPHLRTIGSRPQTARSVLVPRSEAVPGFSKCPL